MSYNLAWSGNPLSSAKKLKRRVDREILSISSLNIGSRIYNPAIFIDLKMHMWSC